MFGIGLAKKTLLADSFAEYSSPVFDGARAGLEPNVVVAWTGALAYTGQIYFDFSGYTDMAIGISRMVGVELSLNFNSPYKAVNSIEFWRRGHMSLSRFLRDYLYIPLGGNRHGTVRRHGNLLATMVLGGPLARCKLDFCRLGRIARRLFSIEPRLARATSGTRGTDRHTNRAFFRAENVESASRVLHGMVSLDPVSSGKSSGLRFAEVYKGYLVPLDSFTYVIMVNSCIPDAGTLCGSITELQL